MLAKRSIIAIDGKSLKGAYDKGGKSSPKMVVSAYAAGLRLTLASVAAKNRNEVDAALEVIGLIDLKGKIVTGDALHCNRRMVDTIVEKGGNYCIALKGNQESLLSEARACLGAADAPQAGRKPPPTAESRCPSGCGPRPRPRIRRAANAARSRSATTDVRIFALSSGEASGDGAGALPPCRRSCVWR